jgi:hypothetical protein
MKGCLRLSGALGNVGSGPALDVAIYVRAGDRKHRGIARLGPSMAGAKSEGFSLDLKWPLSAFGGVDNRDIEYELTIQAETQFRGSRITVHTCAGTGADIFTEVLPLQVEDRPITAREVARRERERADMLERLAEEHSD